MIAASGVFLLRGLIYHTVLRIVSHFLGCSFAFGRPFHVFALGLTANCGALQHIMRGESLGLFACSLTVALCAHVFGLAFAVGFVGTSSDQAYAGHYGK